MDTNQQHNVSGATENDLSGARPAEEVTGADSLRVGQLNLQGSMVVTAESRHIMEKDDISVLLAQEPYVHGEKVRGFGPDTRLVCVGSSKACIAVRDRGVDVLSLAHLTTDHVAVACIKLKSGRELYVVSAYFQFRDPPDRYWEQLGNILHALRGKQIIIGADLNTRSHLWHSNPGRSQVDEDRSRLAEAFILAKNLTVENVHGQPCTFQGPNGASNIDVTLSSLGSGRVEAWRVCPGVSASDHALIRFKVVLGGLVNRTNLPSPPVPRYALRRANWNAFSAAIEQDFRVTLDEPLESIADIDRAVERLTSCLGAAARENLPVLRVVEKPIPWWRPQLDCLRREMNRKRKRFQRTRDEPLRGDRRQLYLAARRAYFSAVKGAKLASWREFLAQSEEDPWGLPYKLMRGKLKREAVWSSLQSEPGIYTESPVETARLVLQSLVPDDDEVAQVDLPVPPPAGPAVNVETVLRAVLRTSEKKAPGLDGILPEFITRTVRVTAEPLSKLYTACLRLSYFPDSWKKGRLIVIPKKEGVDMSQIKSFRPITLLSVPGKILERVIHQHLVNYLDDHAPLSRSQFGFVPGKSTADALDHVLCRIRQRDSRYMLGLFIDIAGAFDNLNWGVLVNRLTAIGVPGHLIAILCSYLEARSVELHLKTFSVCKPVTKGCPQGSVLGPLLWNLVMDTFLRIDYGHGITSVAYADDGLVLIPGNSRKELEDRSAEVLQKLMTWCRDNKLELSWGKTVAVCFVESTAEAGRHVGPGYRGVSLSSRPPVVRYGGRSVRVVKHTNYLGVVLDGGLSFVEHAKKVAEKSRSVLLQLKGLAGRQYGLKNVSLLKIYKAVSEPILVYAADAWARYGLHTHARRAIKSAQRDSLIWALRAYRTTSGDAVCVVAGVMPVDLLIEERVALRAIRRGDDRVQMLTTSVEKRPDGRYGGEAVAQPFSASQAKRVLRSLSLQHWQSLWDDSAQGEITHGFLPEVSFTTVCGLRDHALVQFLTGHGAFLDRLAGFGLVEDGTCTTCGVPDTTMHALRSCRKNDPARQRLKRALGWDNLPGPRNLRQFVTRRALGFFREFCRESALERQIA